MSSKAVDVAVISSAHWIGDPRLNRHVSYINQSGKAATITSTAEMGSRVRCTTQALREVIRTDADVVILPDPELFVLGSLTARLKRKKPVIDIHEDYGKVAAARDWIPGPLRPIMRVLSGLLVGVGRIVAWRVVVAAPELAKRGEIVVLNIPAPGTFDSTDSATKSSRLVYVGDVTIARGALEMIELLRHLDDNFELLIIGRAASETRLLMEQKAAALGLSNRLTMTGRLDHEQAWSLAGGSSVGLSLLQPVPAYRAAVATKIWEYMANGIPPIVSDLPGQAAIVAQIHPDLVCRDTRGAAEVAERLETDQMFRGSVIAAGAELVTQKWNDARPDLAIQEAVSP